MRSPTTRSRTGSTAIPRTSLYERGDVRRRRQGVDGQGLVVAARRGADRPGEGRRHLGRGHGGVDRPAGRLEDGARLQRGLRQEDQQPMDLGWALRRLLPRPREPPPAALDPQPRPARPALVHRLALLLQPGRHLHGHAAGLPAPALPPRPHGLDRLEGTRQPVASALARVGAARRDGLPRRLPLRHERARVERHRRRPARG